MIFYVIFFLSNFSQNQEAKTILFKLAYFMDEREMGSMGLSDVQRETQSTVSAPQPEKRKKRERDTVDGFSSVFLAHGMAYVYSSLS